MDTRNARVIAFTLALAALVGCGSNSTTNTESASGNTQTATANISSSPTPAAKPAAATPTETARQVYDAIRNKDIAAVRAVFTRKTLATMEDVAKKRNQSLDDVLTGFVNDTQMPATFTARNEKIEGDRASVGVADEK